MKTAARNDVKVVDHTGEEHLAVQPYTATLLTDAWPAPVIIPTGKIRRIQGLACEPVRRGRPPSVKH